MTWYEIGIAIGSSSVVTIIVTKIVNKRQENVTIDNTWKQGRELDVKFHDYVKQEVDAQVQERTKELRDTIAENSLVYHREFKAQNETWSRKYIDLEEKSDRKIKLLEMKFEVMERKFEVTLNKLELATTQLNQEKESRKNCLDQVTRLNERLNEYQNKADGIS